MDIAVQYGTIPSSGDMTRVAFLSASAELLITNKDLGAVKIQLYDIITQKDTYSRYTVSKWRNR